MTPSGNPVQISVLDTGIADLNFSGLPGRPIFSGAAVSLPYISSSTRPQKEYPAWKIFPHMPDSIHGTNVAALALGGPTLPDLLWSTGLRLKLDPVRIVDSDEIDAFNKGKALKSNGRLAKVDAYYVNGTFAANVLRALNDGVANLSYAQSDSISELDDINTNHNAMTLVVAAAGNEAQPLATHNIYPAKQGGSSSVNLIVVGSADGTGLLSDFSNYGADYVDILAPGCHVPTLFYDADTKSNYIKPMNGTSASAPQISWLAAVLKWQLSGVPASRIRGRILLSADHDPRLAKKVSEGRRANVIKALSLSRDVAEIRDSPGRSRLIRGKVIGTPVTSDFCSDFTGPMEGPIMKIVTSFDGTGSSISKNRIYWMDSKNCVKGETCSAKGLVTEFHDTERDEIIRISPEALVDITFSWLSGEEVQ